MNPEKGKVTVPRKEREMVKAVRGKAVLAFVALTLPTAPKTWSFTVRR